MNKKDLAPGAFLYFHVKRGVEMHDTKKVPCVSIRGTSIDNMITIGKPLVITVEGEEGMLLLHTDTVKEKELSVSESVFDGGKYHIHRFEWLPIDDAEMTVFDALYGGIEKYRQLIKRHRK